MPVTASITVNFPQLERDRAALLVACKAHMRAHRAGLAAAARCAAGEPGGRMAERLCDDIVAAGLWDIAFPRRMRALCGLLRLDHLDDPGSLHQVPATRPGQDADWVAACCWHAERLDALIARNRAIAARAMPLPRIVSGRPARRPRLS